MPLEFVYSFAMCVCYLLAAAPDAVAQLSITGLSPVSALNKTATATLTFAAPFDHYDPILVYAVRCFDLSVNASLGNDTVVPAPLMPSVRSPVTCGCCGMLPYNASLCRSLSPSPITRTCTASR